MPEKAMFDPDEQALVEQQLRRICLMPRISASEDCRAIIERALDSWIQAGGCEEEFYGWAERFLNASA